MVAGIVMPLLGCSGSDKPEVPKNSSYYTGPLTEKPKGSMTPRSGMVGSEK